jgi:hypothetical protein
MSSETESRTTPLHLIDLDSIPNQIGHAILRASDGDIVRQPTGTLTAADLNVLYKMLLETSDVLNNSEEVIQRVSISGGNEDVEYSISLGTDGLIYIVKKRLG